MADRLTFLGHSTVLIDLDGVRLLTDPLLGHLVAWAIRRHVPAVLPGELEGLSAVFVSHGHLDHLDLAPKSVGSDAREEQPTPLSVLAPPGSTLVRNHPLRSGPGRVRVTIVADPCRRHRRAAARPPNAIAIAAARRVAPASRVVSRAVLEDQPA